jgi:transcriptional regulator with XRE-family HTH domain
MAPKNWNPYRQLIIAGHGSDLILHPRIDSDLEFRYAVDEAFADIRIARQLKERRETKPLTQRELAEKAEMKQSRISELEGLNYSAWTVSTLRRLAKALGVHFVFSFKTWEEYTLEIKADVRPASVAPQLKPPPVLNAEVTAALASRMIRRQAEPITQIEHYRPKKQAASDFESRNKIQQDQLNRLAVGGMR